MLDIKDKGYLLSILNHCDRINDTMAKINKDKFDKNIDYKEIICFNLLQIGEIAKKLSDSFVEIYNEIPWKYIKGMRDKIAHDYGAIDFDVVWETSNNDVVELNKYCKKIIKENR